MIQAQTRDDPFSDGIIIELSGHADPQKGDPPELGTQVCAGVSTLLHCLHTYTQPKILPDPPGSGFLRLCVLPEHFHLMPFICHSLELMQLTYPKYVNFARRDTRASAS
jgi:uncharacterized protein YsxB (DUF464 family)